MTTDLTLPCYALFTKEGRSKRNQEFIQAGLTEEEVELINAPLQAVNEQQLTSRVSLALDKYFKWVSEQNEAYEKTPEAIAFRDSLGVGYKKEDNSEAIAS